MPAVPSAASTPIPASRPLQLPESLSGRAALAVSATLFVALCAHVSVPLFFTPVPLTLQTFAVLIIGLVFGPALGASTLLLYLAEGAAGLPVFSPQGPGGIAQLLGPTGGYLLSYPLAAAAAGLTVRALSDRRKYLPAAALAGAASTVIVFAFGTVWLACELKVGSAMAFKTAVLPFLPGEVLKIAAAVACYATYRRRQRV
ncbi:MAG TPA: biotin transporter BioY [Acidobacteriaceae bacterium]|nr:biotin transporter BioY [Acidobacteriaceae bacterium]